MCYVYALQSVLKKRIYIGQTKDLNRRLQYHNNGAVKSTSKDKPWELIAFQKVESISEARWIERDLKRSRGKRIRWIEEKSLQATPRREGWGRRFYKNEFIKFLIYALASCDETLVHLDFVYKSQYLSDDQYKGYAERYNVLGKKINRYLQMVMRDHLKPQDKNKTESGIENYSEQGIVADE